mmetsp:Transcript_21294/g.33118  ORF Transcript_21294/g.33118 Transcript_21294/m.33118 type:complete len:229 (-) Transcript_21294:334-1020(-)
MAFCWTLVFAEDPIAEIHATFQHELLLSVFRDMTPHFMRNIHLQLPFQDTRLTKMLFAENTDKLVTSHCTLHFVDGLLQQFQMIHYSRIQNLLVDYLPSSVEELEVKLCGQTFKLCPRRFPRDAQVINFQGNRIQGTADLQGLPQRLVSLNLSSNRLSGRISLVFLPVSLKMLNIQRNTFEGKKVYYAGFPKSLEKIYMSRSNFIWMEPVEEKYRIKANDKRISLGTN